MTNWYVQVSGEITGPFGPREIAEMAKSGRLSSGDFIRRGESGPWRSAASISGPVDNSGASIQSNLPPEAEQKKQSQQKNGCCGCLVILMLFGLMGTCNEAIKPPEQRSVEEKQRAAQEARDATAPAPARKSHGLTMAKYQSVEAGMTYAQVVAIIGKGGTELSNIELGGTSTVMYTWEAGFFGANMNATFQDGKLVAKAQTGLK